MITIKKTLNIFLIAIIFLVGCSNEIKPNKIIESEFSKTEAIYIVNRAWKPVNDMKGINNYVKPNIKITSKEEFFKEYDFRFMDERYMYDTIYESVVKLVMDEETKTMLEARDKDGNILFNEGRYIPTLYDKGVFIEKAYLKESIYNEKYSHFDVVELVVIESSDGDIEGNASGFNRKNIFRKNEEDKWILYSIEGTISYGW